MKSCTQYEFVIKYDVLFWWHIPPLSCDFDLFELVFFCINSDKSARAHRGCDLVVLGIPLVQKSLG